MHKFVSYQAVFEETRAAHRKQRLRVLGPSMIAQCSNQIISKPACIMTPLLWSVKLGRQSVLFSAELDALAPVCSFLRFLQMCSSAMRLSVQLCALLALPSALAWRTSLEETPRQHMRHNVEKPTACFVSVWVEQAVKQHVYG